MTPQELLDSLARSTRLPVVARVRHVEGRAAGRWIYLGTYASRSAAARGVDLYMTAHEGQAMQPSIVEADHPEYRAALAAARGTRR